ncbi:hypothetical protein OG21DRAFT_1510700 [Imleria badia]|nr:hypothetical protein OG21DRAFT_1510700 [Imleria badia]
MASNITPGPHRIISEIVGNPPTGIGLILPAFQFVRLNGTQTTWHVRPVGDKTYLLSLGGYAFTGVEDDRVIASVHPQQNLEWIATYREQQKAYTIEPVNNRNYGWTVADPSNDHSEIIIERIKVYYTHQPWAIYDAGQLFKVEPVHGK